MLQNIDYIIFDLGGVLYDVDYHATIEKLNTISQTDFSLFFSQKQQESIVDSFETGKTDENSFFESIGERCQKPCEKEALIEAWNSMLLGFRKSSVDFIQEIQGKMPIYLFSNNNETHYKAIEREVGKQEMDAFNGFFTSTYYSHTFGYRKPHVYSFLKLLEQEKLAPSRGLFIDDSSQHIAGAIQSGLEAKLLKSGERIEEILTALK